ANGSQVLTGSGDATAKLWDAATGAESRTFSGHTDSVFSAAFSPDGSEILTGSRDLTAKLWDVATGAQIRTFSGSVNVWSVAFSPDGSKILMESDRSSANLWDVATGEEIRAFSGHTGNVVSVAFSPDGSEVLTGSSDQTAKLWDAATGEEIRTFSGHTGGLNSVAFSPDGSQVLTGGGDRTAKLLDAATGAEIRTFSGHTGSVYSVAFSPDGSEILTGSGDCTAKLWNVATGAEIRTFYGHTYPVRSAAFSVNGSRALTGGGDGLALLWYTGSDSILLLIRSFYNGILDRDPGPAEQLGWLAYFEHVSEFDIDVRFVPREMARLFFLSEEYALRNRSNQDFLTDCYRVFLNRDPNQTELDNWLSGVWNRSQAVTVFSESEEFANRIVAMFPGLEGNATRNFVTFMYVGLLDRLADQSGLEYASGLFDAAFASGGIEAVRAQAKQMAREVIVSVEFLSKDPSTDIHVVRFYRAFLGRFPSDSEVAYWSGELDAGRQTTDSVIDLFGNAAEFTVRLNQYFGQ
ncbi:MAG TPA: DUF4214 domain-containing protein, partial [Sumerlaeia bacterium]|nr:DUF4214 domain-containing protein [Sumerlaeia bacterium]